MGYENIIVERNDGVAVITLNRPKAMNALSAGLVSELKEALITLDDDDEIGSTSSDEADRVEAEAMARQQKFEVKMNEDDLADAQKAAEEELALLEGDPVLPRKRHIRRHCPLLPGQRDRLVPLPGARCHVVFELH